MPRYEGLIAAPHSPFDARGELTLEVIEKQVDVLVEGKVLAAFVCGSTGESHSLTLDERRAIAARWVEKARGKLDVFVHVGHNCQRDAIALAGHAQSIGAAAVAAMAPSYFKPSSVDDLIEFLAPIASAAPKTPFYYYDIPSMTSVRLPMDQFLMKAPARIPNLVGIKYTSDDLITLQSCLGLEGGRFEMLYGSDEILLAALALGVRGAVGSTYNYAAPLYHRIIASFKAGEMTSAQELQRQSVAMVKVLNAFGGMRAGKAVMGMLGVDCGPVRPPIAALTAGQIGELYERLLPMDIFTRKLRR